MRTANPASSRALSAYQKRANGANGDGTNGKGRDSFSPDLFIRFVPNRDTVTLAVGDAKSDNKNAPKSPFHAPEARPFYPLLVENRSDRARVVELSVLEPFGLPDAAPRFMPEWAEWRLPPPPSQEGNVDALSPDCRVLHLLLLPNQPREIALELLPLSRTGRPAEYLFAVGGREVAITNGETDDEAVTAAGRLFPAVGALKLTHPPSGLMALLPEVYQEAARDERQHSDNGGPSFGERFLLGFGEINDHLDADVAGLPELFGVDTAPSDWLRWLATWVGLTLDDRWPEMRRRELIRHAIPLYRRRGTVTGLADYLELFTGVRPQISDQPVEGMRLGAAAVLGSRGTWLGNIAPHTFVVTLAPGQTPVAPSESLLEASDREAMLALIPPIPDTGFVWDDVTIATLHDIIASNKPAHTAYELRVLHNGATPIATESVPDPLAPVELPGEPGENDDAFEEPAP